MIVLAPDLGHLTLHRLEAEFARLRTLDLDETDRAELVANVMDHVRAHRGPSDEELAETFTPRQIQRIEEAAERGAQTVLTRRHLSISDGRGGG